MKIWLFILDAQVLAMVKMIQQQNGKHGCSNCHHTTASNEIGPLEGLKKNKKTRFHKKI